MMFWVLIVLAALPLIMGLAVFVILRRGTHHRLHERRAKREAAQGHDSAPDPVIIAGWSASDDSTSFAGGGGDFGGGGATGDWGAGDAGDSGGSSDSGGGDAGGGGGDGGGD